MAKPTVAEVQARIETDLSSDALQRMIDAAHFDIESLFGADSQQVDLLEGRTKVIWLSRPADSITSIVETTGSTDTTLVANDYSKIENGWALKRLDTGTNGAARWATEVLVTYVPNQDPRRFDVVIDLIKLSIAFSGFERQQAGDWMTTAGERGDSYAVQRLRILGRMRGQSRKIA